MNLGRVGQVLARSRLYETAPWGDVPQGPFLNAAVLLAWRGSPEALLEALLSIEREAGRVRDVRYGPRTLDLDVLWMEGITRDTPSLQIPHPRLEERAFALWPLLDVAPFATNAEGKSYERGEATGILEVEPAPTG